MSKKIETKEYCVCFCKFDYLFSKKGKHLYDFFTAKTAEEAKALCYFKHGAIIDITEVELF